MHNNQRGKENTTTLNVSHSQDRRDLGEFAFSCTTATTIEKSITASENQLSSGTRSERITVSFDTLLAQVPPPSMLLGIGKPVGFNMPRIPSVRKVSSEVVHTRTSSYSLRWASGSGAFLETGNPPPQIPRGCRRPWSRNLQPPYPEQSLDKNS